MDPKLVRSMLIGPRGGRYYHSRSGQKVYRELHPREETGQAAARLGRHDAQRLRERGLRDGGFTYDAINHIFPSQGFAVSIHKDREQRIQGHIKIKGADFERYAKANADLLRQPGKMLGLWYDAQADVWCLDVSHVETSRAKAEQVATEHEQDGIFDLGKGETIYAKDFQRGPGPGDSG